MENIVLEVTSNPNTAEVEEKLVWKSYATDISFFFSDFMKGCELVDTTLVAGGEKIRVHKMVLSATSSFLKKVLMEVDTPEPCIILPSEVKIEELKLLVDFIYRGEIRFMMSQLPSLSKLAQMLGIPGLPGFTEVFNNSNEEKDPDKVTWIVDETQEVEVFDDDEIEETSSRTVSPEIKDSLLEEEQKDSVPRTGPPGKRCRAPSSISYSQSDIDEGFRLLQSGKSIGQASRMTGVPRTTLYNKAKMSGVIAMQDKTKNYTEEQMDRAIKAVINGQSLNRAAEFYGVTKTVLWRRSKGLKPDSSLKIKTSCYTRAQKMAAVDALKKGERTRKVAQEFGIPPATLYREKVKLVQKGALPKDAIKKRPLEEVLDRQIRVQQAVAACKEGKMSQSSAASHFDVPKTTIWRHLRTVTEAPKVDVDGSSMSVSSSPKDSDVDYHTFVIEGTNLKLISEDDTMSMGPSHYIVLSGNETDSLPGSLQVMLPQNDEGSVVCEVEELTEEVEMDETINEAGGKA
ncbi:uncharacterized protein LOC132196560 isoform X2 [Neocloeon triangulifer]|uniref:uncharacterized protein LOC132196560 isoform X2 n=1 Tax=Neocloeon triangulifer TaxID=2078957 RepID=UPI00286F92FA|nr:uncharacterized protein LOC132196560 isoform X2 [Neocloeon triangulifer]